MDKFYEMVARALNSLDPTDQGDVLLAEVVMALLVVFQDEDANFDDDKFLELLSFGDDYKDWLCGIAAQGD